MNKKLKEKVMEALSSVVPITAIVLLLSFTMAPMPVASLILFLVGALLLIVGVGFFSLGVDMAMMPIGDGIGEQVARGSKLCRCVLSSGCLSPLRSRTSKCWPTRFPLCRTW